MAEPKPSLAFQEITEFLSNIHPISVEAGAHLIAQCSYFQVKKGKFLRSPIDHSETIYFIVKGLIRGFIKEDGQEITTWLNDEGNMVGSVRNLGLRIETEEYIQALEDSTLIGISQQALDEMYERFVEANIIGRKLLERYYRDADERAFLCRLPSAEKRYRRFAATRPSLLGRVTLKYIASYLNMKVETLCRVKAKME
ncbi:Crp/Fnr family transcriptional regulator [Sphingobacterium bambusae]|uniref:Crp/Fnr family transcriptional regulator n=1 Tax=Sphingobacterium bambusae TaxID=662858 RepID=A0ABW6BEC4_9SPHI|nr:Crp/Fnr family transcriptional regulator [Sphingobacterium bambusae]WPL46962.1 Crp/Fnr family transcriptional regulator [Sphingobacterium bambusae]